MQIHERRSGKSVGDSRFRSKWPERRFLGEQTAHACENASSRQRIVPQDTQRAEFPNRNMNLAAALYFSSTADREMGRSSGMKSSGRGSRENIRQPVFALSPRVRAPESRRAWAAANTPSGLCESWCTRVVTNRRYIPPPHDVSNCRTAILSRRACRPHDCRKIEITLKP
jgi:hypothetical protein